MWEFEEYSTNIALLERNEEISYGELDWRQKRFCQDLPEKFRGLILMQCQNTLECAVAYVSCIKNRIPLMPVSQGITERCLGNLIGDYRPEYLYVPEECIEKQIKIKEEYRIVRRDRKYCLLKRKAEGSFSPLYEELAVVLLTSGSTGASKCVRISYENLKENTKAIAAYLGLTEKDRTITSLPLQYCFGLSILNSFLYAGASLVLTGKKVYSAAFWEEASHRQITSFSGVPATYELFCKLNLENYNLSCLRVMTQAGGQMNREIWEKMMIYARQRNLRFYVMYGQTEATARIGYLNPERAACKYGSIGKAIPGGKLSIMNEDGTECRIPYQRGEICYYGRNVALGYAECRKHLEQKNEWKYVLKTGDIGYYDEEGDFYIIGRKRRIAKLNGIRIDLEDVEQQLRKEFLAEFRCSEKEGKLEITGNFDERETVDYIVEQTEIKRMQIKYRKNYFEN